MTTIMLADWTASPEIIVGQEDHRRLTIAALTSVGERGDHMDYLLYELDRARILPDSQLPQDVVRVGSIVRYKAIPGDELAVKLVMPDEAEQESAYRLSVTSPHGAALLGARPGHVMTWLSPDGETLRLKVLSVANPPSGDDPGFDDDPGPMAA